MAPFSPWLKDRGSCFSQIHSQPEGPEEVICGPGLAVQSTVLCCAVLCCELAVADGTSTVSEGPGTGRQE
ncbi:uncharacterized [Tachysurus ichikawai]